VNVQRASAPDAGVLTQTPARHGGAKQGKDNGGEQALTTHLLARGLSQPQFKP